jgi:hypothetical protein
MRTPITSDSLRVVLSESQIKVWFSSESGHRKKAAVNRVFEKGFTELSSSIDLQDNQLGFSKVVL